MEPTNIGESLLQAADSIISGIGDNFGANGASNRATAEYNSAVASLIKNKAQNETAKTQQLTKAVNTMVIGLLLILGVYVIAKYVIPAVK